MLIVFFPLVANTQLRGRTELDAALVQQYVNFADQEILPAACTWTYPTLGIMQYNQQVHSYVHTLYFHMYTHCTNIHTYTHCTFICTHTVHSYVHTLYKHTLSHIGYKTVSGDSEEVSRCIGRCFSNPYLPSRRESYSSRHHLRVQPTSLI